MHINEKNILKFKNFLTFEEKSDLTIEKYVRDITNLSNWLGKKGVTKKLLLEYKNLLIKKYAPASVNSIISSLNTFFIWKKKYDLKIKSLKIQKQIFSKEDKELTKDEYRRLLAAAKNKKNERLYLLMQTICSTGIRVSELKFITVKAVYLKRAVINLKGKTRIVLIPDKLCHILLKYIKKNNIKDGSVFVTKGGKPLNRSNIWLDMKKLCEDANVQKDKVFPHNLRHLFARTYYTVERDIVRLADILGHTSVNTTRIYTMEPGEIHRNQIQRLGLLIC
ncbi:MAG: integrase [Ruminococcaceae bacterium]|nr:integrase [Oscillospiraceae bacterium]